MEIKHKWETERNIISKENWEELFKEGHEMFSSIIWKEFEWKVKMRYFLVLLHISKYSKVSNKCWRICGQVADDVQLFQDCHKLTEYWKNIKNR